MVYRETMERIGAVFLTPFLWWQTLCESHFEFVDQLFAAAAMDRALRRERRAQLRLVK